MRLTWFAGGALGAGGPPGAPGGGGSVLEMPVIHSLEIEKGKKNKRLFYRAYKGEKWLPSFPSPSPSSFYGANAFYARLPTKSEKLLPCKESKYRQ